MDAQCTADDGATQWTPAARNCCTVPIEGGREDEENGPVTPAESHCAFCNLLIAHTDPPLGIVTTLLPKPVHADHVPLSVQVAQKVPFAAAPNRAPPA